MSKTFRSILSIFLVLAIGVVLVYVGHRLYLQNAPRKPQQEPDWAKKISPQVREAYQKQLRRLAEARDALRANRQEGIAKLRDIIKTLSGTAAASQAKIDLALALAEEAAGKDEALRLLTEVANEPKAGKRSLHATLSRARMLADTDPVAAARDFDSLINADNRRRAASIHADASLGRARLHLKQGEPVKAIGLVAPILATRLAQKADATVELRKAIRAHAKRLADAGQWQELLRWTDGMLKKFPTLPGFKSGLRYRQAVAYRMLGRHAQARTLLDRLRRDVPAELLGDEIDLDSELAAIAQAEEAVGIWRSPEAFLRAVKAGKEARAHFQGEIASDTTWSAANSPLVLTGIVTVKQGATLTLGPGARVEFLQGARIVVEGALAAVGTAQKPVLLTSAVVSPGARTFFDGEGIEFAKTSDASKSRLEYCTIEYQRIGVACRGVPLVIRHCTFRRCGQTALLVTDEAEPTVEECTFEANDGTAIRAIKSSPTIRRCRILKNGRTGIAIERASTATIESNRIVGNGRRGIECDNGASATIRGNLIEGNRDGIWCNRRSHATIEGNIIRKNGGGGKGSGIGIHAERESDCQIVGNAILGNGGIGVRLSGTDAAVVKNNRIVGNGHYGIENIGAAPLIEGNLIERNRSAAIANVEASQPTIHRNILGYHDPSFIGNTGSLDIDARENYFVKGKKPPSDEDLERWLFDQKDRPALGRIHWKPRLTARPPEPPMPVLKGLPE